MQLDQRDADPLRVPPVCSFQLKGLLSYVSSDVDPTWSGLESGPFAARPCVSALPKYVGAWAVLCRCMAALRISEVEAEVEVQFEHLHKPCSEPVRACFFTSLFSKIDF